MTSGLAPPASQRGCWRSGLGERAFGTARPTTWGFRGGRREDDSSGVSVAQHEPRRDAPADRPGSCWARHQASDQCAHRRHAGLSFARLVAHERTHPRGTSDGRQRHGTGIAEFIRYSPEIETFDPKLEEYMKQIIDHWETKVTASPSAGGSGHAVRGAHAKTLGCARAEVTIHADVRGPYAPGVYAHPGDHDALIR